MRSSNSKEARRAIERYILDVIEDRTDHDEPATARPITRAFETLREEMSFQSYQLEKGREIIGEGLAQKYRAAGRLFGYVSADTPYWVWYLAVFKGEFEAYTDGVYTNIMSWLDESPAEADRYSSDQAWRHYAHLTASAFQRLYDRETTPHRIPTSEFRRIYQEHDGGYFFDRDTMRYYHQRMSDISVTAFYLVTDERGAQRDCYRVESWQRTDYDERRRCVVWYFDRETLQAVHPTKKEV